MATNVQNLPPEKFIQTQRIIWGMLLMGPPAIAVVTFATLPSQAGPPPPNLDVLIWVSGAGLLLIPIVFVVRAVLFQKSQVDGVVPMGIYARGNIIYWAGCEGVAVFGVICALDRHTFWPTILFSAAAMLLQLAVFPRLSAIRPRPSTFQIE